MVTERDRDKHRAQKSPSLPVSRSFVVQFTADTTPATSCFRGRVEHIASARSQRFASLDDLTTFMAEVIALEAGDEPG